MLNDATAAIEAALERRGSTAFDKPRVDAAAQVHQLTFTLVDSDAKVSLDEVCKQAAQAVIVFAATEPVVLKTLPPMRPKPKADVAQRATPTPADHSSVAQLSEEAGRMTLSAPLKEQTAVVAKLVNTLGAQAGKEKEADALSNVLAQAVDLERGLSANTAVTPDARAQLEGQLTQAWRCLPMHARGRWSVAH